MLLLSRCFCFYTVFCSSWQYHRLLHTRKRKQFCVIKNHRNPFITWFPYILRSSEFYCLFDLNTFKLFQDTASSFWQRILKDESLDDSFLTSVINFQIARNPLFLLHPHLVIHTCIRVSARRNSPRIIFKSSRPLRI